MASFLSPSLPHFPPSRKTTPSRTKYRFKVSNFPSKNHLNHCKPLSSVRNVGIFSFQQVPKCSEDDREMPLKPPTSSKHHKPSFLLSGYFSKPERGVIQCLTRPILYALFCFAVGFYPFRALPSRAAVAVSPAAAEAAPEERGKQLTDEENCEEHEYSEITVRLLEEVSGLLKCVAEVRRGNGSLEDVELELKKVKTKKKELQEELMEGMRIEMRELIQEKESLEKQANKIKHELGLARLPYEYFVFRGEYEEMKVMEKKIQELDPEYDRILERLWESEERILKRETMAWSAARDLSFIDRECETLVKKFSQEMRLRRPDSWQKRSITKLSRSEIQEELELAQRKLLEEAILPNVVEVEGLGPLSDEDLVDFAAHVKQGLKYSRKLQKDVESHIRKKMTRFGDEKRFLVKTPEEEVVKGFPEVELKWMFGDKEVVVPNAIHNHLYYGWKKWREEAKDNLKRKLLEDVDLSKQYVAQKQEQVLLDRDRVTSKTWYNEDKNRWEMDPIAVPFAVSKKLAEHARIRHDWGAMYISLKEDDREYYVDLKEFEMLYEDSGGVDGLYMKMLAQGIPTVVQPMPIPFSELDLHQQFLLTMKLARQWLKEVWKSGSVSSFREGIMKKIRDINEDIVMMIVFPFVDFFIPYPVRMQLGMVWSEDMDDSVGTTWYSKWKSEAELNFNSKRSDINAQWFLGFLIRLCVYGYILFHVFQFVKRNVRGLLSFGPLQKDPIVMKLRRLRLYTRYKRGSVIKKLKVAGDDPLATAFDRMKRVKNPPIPLKNFASVESMREEINEVVAFLQNPRAFQEIGARAPRGVLIVGERGTGKTSLALAIAAEAKVPVVDIKPQLLEAGRWAGQGASNVRELFQTARNLAPVIIFVEDFDLFAGVRGKFIHTKKQDHEAFINQLLVELDGFEKQDGVVLMATTSNIKQIDEALKRPGRMDRVFHLQKPTQAEREKILHTAAKETMDEDLIEFVDWKKVAEKTALLQPLELKLVPVALEGSAFRSKFLDRDELMSYCSWFATFSSMVPEWVQKTKLAKKMNRMLVNHLGLALTKDDLQNVVDLMEPYGQISNGIELMNPPINWTSETKFPHAVWAAGRGLIALLLPNFDVVDNLWLEPSSWQGIGCTKISKVRNEDLLNGNMESRTYLEKKLVFCFGSYVASQLLLPFGEENFLSSSELKQAQEIATRMVIQYGWGPDDSPAIYYSNHADTSLSMGNNHAYEMAARVETMYESAYLKAKQMLQKNRGVLEKIVEELVEFEVLTGKDLERMLRESGGSQEKEPFSLTEINYTEPELSRFLGTGNGSGSALLGSSA